MILKATFCALITLVCSSLCRPQDSLEAIYQHVREKPKIELTLLDGRVHIIDVYKLQVMSVYESRAEAEEDRIGQYVADVYSSYREFWNNFFFNEVDFRKWASKYWQKLQSPSSPGFLIPLEIDFDSLFTVTANRLRALTSREPEGRWFLAYGNMASNIGGFDNGDMFVDFFGVGKRGADHLIFNLPHEMNHQIFGKSNPDDGTLLHRILDEGFSCYVNYLYWNKEQSPAKNTAFTPQEWQWCIDNEARIFSYARTFLDSTNPDIIGRFQRAHRRIFDGAPDRIAYFIGFRICQAYVKKHGDDAWRQLYDLRPKDVLESSGYEDTIGS